MSLSCLYGASNKEIKKQFNAEPTRAYGIHRVSIIVLEVVLLQVITENKKRFQVSLIIIII